jgi:DNA helicase-2/ATP-dependent DNA helicase PcrA
MDKQKSLTIVGDPDQSIYGFRNADVTNFNKMHTDYNNVTTICLEQNYRSTLCILQAASIVINNGKLDEPQRTNMNRY